MLEVEVTNRVMVVMNRVMNQGNRTKISHAQ